MEDSYLKLYILFFIFIFLLGLAGFILLEISPSYSPGQNTVSYAFLGHRAYMELLQKRGFAVYRKHNNQFPLQENIVVFYLTPQNIHSSHFLQNSWSKEVIQILEKGGTVVISLPKWHAVPHRENPLWIEKKTEIPLSLSLEPIMKLLDTMKMPRSALFLKSHSSGKYSILWKESKEERFSLALDKPRFFSKIPNNAKILAEWKNQVWAFMMEWITEKGNKGYCIILSDGDIFANGELVKEENGLLAYHLAEFVGKQEMGNKNKKLFFFDEVTHGLGAVPSLIQLAFRYPMFYLSFHILLFLLLWVLKEGQPFIRKKKAPKRERSRKELVETMGFLTHATGHHEYIFELYWKFFIADLEEEFPSLKPLKMEGKIEVIEEVEKERGLQPQFGKLYQRSLKARKSHIPYILAAMYQWKEKFDGSSARTQSENIGSNL